MLTRGKKKAAGLLTPGFTPGAGPSSLGKPEPTLEERLKANLAPFREATLGLARGKQVVSSEAIVKLEQCDPDDIQKSNYYNELEDVEFYAIVKEEKSARVRHRNGVPDDRLWNAAIMHRLCSIAVYVSISLMREWLTEDTAIDAVQQDIRKSVVWKRRIVRPQLVMFSEDTDNVPVYEHDLIYVYCTDGSKFVIDLTADQFGFDEWFYTLEDFRAKFWTSMMNPIFNEAKAIKDLENEEPRLPALREAVEESMAAIEKTWKQNGVARMTMHLQTESQQRMLLKGVADKVQQAVEDELKSLAQDGGAGSAS